MTEPEAAVAMIEAQQPERSILLIRRAERKGDSWSGHWSFPGGWRHAGDQDLLATAIRELEEECGVNLPRECLEETLQPVWARRKVGKFVLVAPFVFRVDQQFATVLNPQEAVEAIWMPLDMILDPHRHALRRAPGRPPEMLFPGIELNGLLLWGFTYRLALDWLGLKTSHRPVERAGREAAGMVLDFLVSQGLTVERGWSDKDPSQAARVTGKIPVDAVLSHFSEPGRHFTAINCLEVRHDQVRLAGPAWEDYFILAGDPGTGDHPNQASPQD